ncbi:pilin [Eikenella sp. S3360]|uniref:Pilin n=1 Tax=Eikenella glucosivorans TaxID=2766967 RepID=A0ABS0N9B5_9NEIS|nr:pilin [Eikenella glucosivorans]MBH5328854.1 pilin [Eikenella glucosivorans]
MYKQKGFTLIELMIVIAIIGILAAIALPLYQDHMAKAQITRVFYELGSTKTAVESILAHGGIPTVNPAQDGAIQNGKRLEFLGLDKNPNSNLIFTASIGLNNNQFERVNATFGRNALPQIQGAVISLVRNNNGEWTCEIDNSQASYWPAKYTPATCVLI